MTIKNIKNGIKTTIKLTTKTIKAIIAGTKALISLLLAGGWIAVTIIVIICLIGLICSSTFGIFFSNEIKSADGKNMSSVVSEINIEFVNKITEIQNSVNYDDYEINSDRAEWKDVISVYTVLITEGKEQSDVITLDNNKIEKLRSVFWEMNTILSRIENIEKGIISKFANCQNEGIGWFKTCGLWQKAGYIPKARRYYIF